ncbi:DoxX family protein [Streptomyces aidingensis]|uniref:DoxX family protein n=1 Tax=Streptomyces aidingensis TaxID=910347 RepID=UPI001FE5A4BD|nr:DoxX family membrane protein [Streptomyces aidingensis]
MLNTVKVPCDPAQIIVNHASFRVELGAAGPEPSAVPSPVPVAAPHRVPAAGVPGGGRRAVVLSGRGDTAARLLAAARPPAGPAGHPDAVATQVLPRVTETALLPAVAPQRVATESPVPAAPRRAFGGGTADTVVLPPVRPAGGGPPAHPGRDGHPDTYAPAYEGAENGGGPLVEVGGPGGRPAGARAEAARRFYPDRRINLGIVLLPLRLLLGFLLISAGLGKLTDPVYFDGGERGSMVQWLSGLEPWALAQPLHSWAVAHPVGAGLTVAFTQIIVGALTIAGLWQRLAAVLGALLSVALLMTVSWQAGPAYDTPDIILLAAWSPLVIAGAPVYSLDARLAGEAWRSLGPRAPLTELRRRVLRRGALLATLLIGVIMVLGSVLGGAVRSTEEFETGRDPYGEQPRNSRQGSPLPSRTAGADGASPGDGPDGGAGPAEESSRQAEEETGGGETASPEAEESAAEESASPETGGLPGGEQTVPASPEESAAAGGEASPAESGAGPEETGGETTEPGGGTGSESPPEAGDGTSGSSESDGGDQGSLGRIGGLLG